MLLGFIITQDRTALCLTKEVCKQKSGLSLWQLYFSAACY